MKDKHHHHDQAPPPQDGPETMPANDVKNEVANDEPVAVNPESEIDKLQKENAELREKLIYLQADYQNFRKRTGKDISDARALGAANVLEPFITVYDFLNMAQVAAQKSDNIESLRQGLGMIINEYNKAFQEIGIVKLNTVNQPFDPAIHDAAAHEHSDTVPENHIIKEWSGAYKLGERILRAARVVVSSGPQKNDATESEEKAE